MTFIPENFTFNTTFSKNMDFLADWERISQTEENFATPLYIEQYINAKNLSCPMPLLKLKMALKNTQIDNSLYVTATDPNSTQDIGAFCQHLGYSLWTSSTDSDSATIFHLLITKNS